MAFPSIFASSSIISLISLVVVAINKFVRTKKFFKKIVAVIFNNSSSFAKSKAIKLKLKVKEQSTTSFSILAKKFANKISFLRVNIYQIFFNFNANFDATSNNRLNSNKNIDNKTSINATTITKISLNKKNRVIASEIVSYCDCRLLNKRFKIIQKAKQKRKKKKNKLLVLKNYTLVYIVVFDNSIFFKQNNRLIVVCNINS